MNTSFSKRVEKIITHYKLTSAQFADQIGVPRSSVSHVLNQRNKPSLDFVLKVVKAYPDVNLYWLLNNKGNFPPTNEINPQQTDSKDGVGLKAVEEIKTETKEISKVIVFYTDNTFETYNARK